MIAWWSAGNELSSIFGSRCGAGSIPPAPGAVVTRSNFPTTAASSACPLRAASMNCPITSYPLRSRLARSASTTLRCIQVGRCRINSWRPEAPSQAASPASRHLPHLLRPGTVPQRLGGVHSEVSGVGLDRRSRSRPVQRDRLPLELGGMVLHPHGDCVLPGPQDPSLSGVHNLGSGPVPMRSGVCTGPAGRARRPQGRACTRPSRGPRRSPSPRRDRSRCGRRSASRSRLCSALSGAFIALSYGPGTLLAYAACRPPPPYLGRRRVGLPVPSPSRAPWVTR